ncbi:unnamed protein product [Cunninghamella blakesleeana]
MPTDLEEEKEGLVEEEIQVKEVLVVAEEEELALSDIGNYNYHHHNSEIEDDMEEEEDNHIMDWTSQPPIASYYNVANSLQNNWESYDYESNIRGTTLERLQLYSESTSIYHRMSVVKELLPTLKDINIEDAIQYVLPIFHKISVDRDESVREMLASDIDQIVLHFFTYSPPSILKNTSTSKIKNNIPENGISQSNGNSSSLELNHNHTTDTTNDHITISPIDLEASAPVATIPSQVFSFALIELLLDQKTIISTLALQSIISITSSILASAERIESNDYDNNSRIKHKDENDHHDDDHQQYCISLLDQEIVQGIILELYHIIKGERTRHLKQHKFIPISTITNDLKNNHDNNTNNNNNNNNSSISGGNGNANDNDDDDDSDDDEYNNDDNVIQSIDRGEIHLSKVACLSLISSLAQYVGSIRCEETCLTIIEELSMDDLFHVRREAAVAIGSIVYYIPCHTIIDRLIPLYYLLARDPTPPVRMAIILTLPTLCELLPHEQKCKIAVESVALFMKDTDYNVRFTLAKVIGEVIAKFLPENWEVTGQPGNVPESIIKFFLSLGDNTSHQSITQESIEDECSLLCAYSFPAAVLTAGATFWDTHFKEKYMRLAKDHQLKVRLSFAHSLHAIAKIIGPERTERDLIHIFALYILDVDDEIKLGILEHLADFLSCLGIVKRLEYLPVLAEIWESVVTHRTLRHVLVTQLALIIPLTTHLDQVIDHILPLVISGCQDEVAIIRETSTQVFSAIIRHFKHDATHFEILMNLLAKELNIFISPSSNYRRRQLFANVCFNMLTNGLPYEDFIKYLLPKILPLTNDSVANVRIAVSKCLGALYYKLFVLNQHLHNQELHDAIKKLAIDNDQDVRHFVEGMIVTTKSSLFTQQQQQIGDLLSELPSPPSSPTK